MTDHLFIPDTQVRPGVDTKHIKAAGKLIVDRRPGVIVIIGDWWDFPSMSSFESREKSVANRRDYTADYRAGQNAMRLLLKPLKALQAKQKSGRKKVYKPRLVFTQGNHEYRVDRALETKPEFEALFPRIEAWIVKQGFEYTPYKEATTIDGVTYSHNCPQTKSAGCVERAHLIMARRHSSWSVGHSQVLDYFVSPHFPRLQCLIAGAFYTHDEEYKTGSNDHWRGLVYKHNVVGGNYDPEFISIDGLMARYG